MQTSQAHLNAKQIMSGFHFIFIAGVTVFLYFELMTQLWFVTLLGGYLIKVWVPPLLFFYYILITKMAGQEVSLRVNFTNIMLLVYAIFGIIAMLWNETLYFAIKYYLIMIAPVWFYFVIIENFKDNRAIELIIKILFFCGFLLSIYMLTLQSSSTEITREIVTSAGNIVELSEAAYAERIAGKWMSFSRGLSSYEIGKYCGMLAPFILFSILFYFQSKKKVKYVYLAIGGFLVYQTINAMSRSAISSLFLGIAVLLYILYRNEKGIRAKIVITSFCFFTISAVYVIEYKMIVVRRFLQLLNFLEIDLLTSYLQNYGLAISSIEQADLHITSIGKSLNAFYQSPLLGAGYGFSEHVINEHNRYLFILVSSGLLTLIAYVSFFTGIIILTRRSIRNFSHFESQTINYGYLFYACGIMFLFKLLNEGMETFYYWIFFSLASAWVLNCKREALTSEGRINGKENSSKSLPSISHSSQP